MEFLNFYTTKIFLRMFVRKEATSSSQIEGTRATIADAIEAEITSKEHLSDDVDDILYYIKALNFGLARSGTLPLYTRLICELHRELMKGARSSGNPFPGEIRYTQNWIRGISLSNALFVPPPPHEVHPALSDLEKFIHSTKEDYPPLIKAALIHAQFETIHPFVDGNGRAGRLLITLFLWKERLLEISLLYLSDFFKKHHDLYHTLLHHYHGDPPEITSWIDFFLEGIIETSKAAIQIAQKINQILENDMAKVLDASKGADSTLHILRHLYGQPIVDIAKIQEWTGFTRAGSQKVIEGLR